MLWYDIVNNELILDETIDMWFYSLLDYDGQAMGLQYIGEFD